MTRGEKAGIRMADSLCEFIHLMYQHKTAHRVLNALIKRLVERKPEYIAVTKRRPPNDRP